MSPSTHQRRMLRALATQTLHASTDTIMPRPQAYAPEYGYQYQFLARCGTREWEHLDYATDRADRKHLADNYRDAYRGTGTEVKSIPLPAKYHHQPKRPAARRKRRASRATA